ncbi:MAG: thioesterase family protein [Candidatus Desulfatibia sp.]|jgi:acyl-CoA thioester hydrolase|uniref:acyl-CoA thioesterase n=1 Tax=Candidatus Desulfatibia sp. TaxID=3101189 RepID=UPI002F31C97B
MRDEFCHLLRVRYSECDAQKVVFYGRYADYIDIAVTEFMRVIWGNYNDILSKGIDNQVVKLSINWKAPAHFDDVIAITVKSIRVGTSSYTLQVQFSNHKTAVNIASAEIIYVMVSAGEHKKMEIPKDMRKKLEEGSPGTTIDHAGVDRT